MHLNDKIATYGLAILIFLTLLLAGSLEAHHEREDRREVQQGMTLETCETDFDCEQVWMGR